MGEGRGEVGSGGRSSSSRGSGGRPGNSSSCRRGSRISLRRRRCRSGAGGFSSRSIILPSEPSKSGCGTCHVTMFERLLLGCRTHSVGHLQTLILSPSNVVSPAICKVSHIFVRFLAHIKEDLTIRCWDILVIIALRVEQGSVHEDITEHQKRSTYQGNLLLLCFALLVAPIPANIRIA
jgi:hypothetical protein